MTRLPVVRDGALHLTPDAQPIAVDAPAWFAWLETARSFAFVDASGTFTARQETRSGRHFWYAYRQQENVLRKAYLGRSADLTLPKMQEAARHLAQPTAQAHEPASPTMLTRWTAPLIATKIAMPPADPAIIKRQGIVDRCIASVMRPCTVIAAPPGFGKTTLALLACAKLNDQGWRIAWVSLEESEQDPARFWTYVFAALGSATPGLTRLAQTMPTTPRLQPDEFMLTALINELAQFPGHIAVVLDDYHRAASPANDAALAFLVEHAPSALHLMLTTRAEPAFLPARLRAQGRVATLSVADLRFSAAESEQFLRETMHLTLPAEQLARMATQAEGWAAGLQLAALSVGDHSPTDSPADLNTPPRYVAEYLIDEVLSRQPPDVQAFLLQTSVLERLCAPLCDAITGRDDSADVLARMLQAQLFLTPLDAAHTWFRYHHLFAEVLRQRQTRTGPVAARQCHIRAAQWLKEQGDLSEAIRHFIAAKAFDEAATLIETESDRLFLRGEITSFVALGRSLPSDVVLAHPHLCVLLALGLIFQSTSSEAVDWLDQLERCQAAATQATGIQGEIMVARSIHRLLNTDFTGSTSLANQALDLLPPEDHLMRVLALWLVSIIGMVGDDKLELVHRRVNAIAEQSLQSGNHFVAYIALVTRAAAEMYQARLRQIAQTCREALRLLPTVNDAEMPVAAMAYCMLSEIRREWNDLNGAEAEVRHAMAVGMYPSNSEFLNDGMLNLAMLQAERGQREESLATFAEIGHFIRTQQLASMDMYQLEVLRARAWLMQGNITEAARWAEECQARREAGDPLAELTFLREIQDLALARVALALDHPAEALRPLEAIRVTAQHAGRLRNLMEAHMLLACAHWHLGEIASALRELDAALAIAAPENFIRVFLDEGEPMADLLAAYVAQRPPTRERAHALALLAAFGRPVTTPQLTQSPPLSARELDVLRLLAAGHTNDAIAADLVVARSTVKWHVAQLARKLGASGRVQIIARARELGLLA